MKIQPRERAEEGQRLTQDSVCQPACPTQQGEGPAQVGVDNCMEHIEQDWVRELDTQV